MHPLLIAVLFLIPLVFVAILGGIFGDTDGAPASRTPDQIKHEMRGLHPGIRFLTAIRLLGHAATNLFVEGVTLVGVTNLSRARSLGRFLVVFTTATIIFIVWSLTML